MNKLKQLAQLVHDRLGCVPPFGLAYKIYDFIAGSVDCACCKFWRGIFIGILLGVGLALIF